MNYVTLWPLGGLNSVSAPGTRHPIASEMGGLLAGLLLAPALAVLALSVGLSACHTKEERAAEKKAPEQAVVAPDGSIHLTPEQVQANGLKTAAVVEQEVAATLNALPAA